MNLMQLPRMAYLLSRSEGPKWIAYRTKYAARRRLGIVSRQLPLSTWDEYAFEDDLVNPALANPSEYLRYRREEAPPFLFKSGDRSQSSGLLTRWDLEDFRSPIAEARAVLDGTLELFAHTPINVGLEPGWNVNPFSGNEAPNDRHWSRISDFDHGDIKSIWDLSRFGFVYPLVRAYWRTGDEALARRFWDLVEHWLQNNQPQQGPNWKCGQETSLRLMAWCFGLYGFKDSPETTAERVSAMGRAVAVSAKRIAANVEYSISQRNNHGMSEALGLWTAGSLFPEFQGSTRWRARGAELLERQARDLIYDDGGFSQHSVNYHRLMLHLYLWVMRLGDILGNPFSDGMRSRIASAGELLYQLQDDHTGRLPCYGQNDGSLILRLSNCDYQDFRPVLQAVRYLTTGTRYYDDGPWDEELYWLFGPQACDAPIDAPLREDLDARQGGYFTLRSAKGFAFVRCADFEHRPGEADMLHVDIWWRGINIATDAGTYSYNRTPPWSHEFNVLSHTQVHNTVTVDDLNQMDRVKPFLWLPWLKGTVRGRARSSDRQLGYWEGEHDGYTRLDDPVTHRRAVVQLGPEHWLVLDDLHANQPHAYRLHWLLADLPHHMSDQGPDETFQTAVELQTQFGPYTVSSGVLGASSVTSLVRADDHSPRGWRSPYYMDPDPALSLAVEHAGTSSRFWTIFGPGSIDILCTASSITCRGEGWSSDLTLSEDHDGSLVKRVRLVTQAGESALEISP